MSVPDRDLVREALKQFDSSLKLIDSTYPDTAGLTNHRLLAAAARAWLEQGNAIIIRWCDKHSSVAGNITADFPICEYAEAHSATLNRPGDACHFVKAVLSVEGDQPSNL